MRTSRTDAQIAHNLADSFFRREQRKKRITEKLKRAGARYRRNQRILITLEQIRAINERMMRQAFNREN